MSEVAGHPSTSSPGIGATAVTVSHNAGASLRACVDSLLADGVDEVIVVDNASSDGSCDTLGDVARTAVVRTGSNLGYGAGANRGIAASATELVLVTNPDVVVHPGALGALAGTLRSDPLVGVCGPRLLQADGTPYPAARRFPTPGEAAGHALLGVLAPGNRFSRRYRMADRPPDVPCEVDWLSGACFMARRDVLEELGGFDESYFMYLEDLDLCWRAHRAGWRVVHVPDAVVTHHQGMSTARHPYRMLLEHHRSALRFATRSADGWRRALIPVAAAVLAVRFVTVCVARALGTRRGGVVVTD